MIKLLPKVLIAILSFVVPIEALAQFAYTTSVTVDPRCLHGLPMEPAFPTQMTFTFFMRNDNPAQGPNARTLYFVWAMDTDDLNQGVAPVVALGPGGASVTTTRVINWWTGSLRLRPRGFVSAFTTNASANTYRDAVVTMMSQIDPQLVDHQNRRTVIQTNINALITAIESSAPSAMTLRQDILQLELQDHFGPLSNMDNIRAGGPAPGTWLDGAIVKLDLNLFQRRQEAFYENPSGGNDRFLRLREMTEGSVPGEESPGGALWKNDDNDNVNLMYDRDESSQVNNEDDLTPLWWFFAKPVMMPNNWAQGGTSNWGFSVIGGAGTRIRYWDTVTKGNALTLPDTDGASYAYDVAYLEGYEYSSADLAEVFTLRFGGNMLYQDVVRATVLAIQTVTFTSTGMPTSSHLQQAVDGLSFARFDVIDHERETVIPGGEFRLFPCRGTYNGNPNTVVRVLVTITPQRSDQRVWVRSYDVDDPSWTSFPVDDDTAQGGDQDNRPTVIGTTRLNGLLKRLSGSEADSQGRIDEVTNVAGQVEFDFDISMVKQPGNNFRVVAGFTPDALSDHLITPKWIVTAKVGYNSDPPLDITDSSSATDSQLAQTPLLTIWRKLHFEVDRMAAANGGNIADGASGAIGGAGNTILTVVTPFNDAIYQGEADLLDTGPLNSPGRFESQLPTSHLSHVEVPGGGPTRTVLSNTDTTLNLQTDGSALSMQATVWLYDDDTVWDSADPDVTYLQSSYDPQLNALAEAYIYPEYDNPLSLEKKQVELSFQMYSHDPAGYAGSAGSITFHHAEFWIAYVQASYQVDTGHDNDPGGTWGANAIPADTTANESPGKTFYCRETVDDVRIEDSLSLAVVHCGLPHEIGHQLGLPHRNSGIMVTSLQEMNNVRQWFIDQDIHDIRSEVIPVSWTGSGP